MTFYSLVIAFLVVIAIAMIIDLIIFLVGLVKSVTAKKEDQREIGKKMMRLALNIVWVLIILLVIALFSIGAF